MCSGSWEKNGATSFLAWTHSKGSRPFGLRLVWPPHLNPSGPYPSWLESRARLPAILGHTFPVWLRFRGGKGVATSAGVLLGLMPLAVVSVFLVWLGLFKMTRYVSVASIGAAFALPFFVALYLRIKMLTGASLLPFSILIAGVVIWRHRSNIQRLLHGNEQRFGQE